MKNSSFLTSRLPGYHEEIFTFKNVGSPNMLATGLNGHIKEVHVYNLYDNDPHKYEHLNPINQGAEVEIDVFSEDEPVFEKNKPVHIVIKQPLINTSTVIDGVILTSCLHRSVKNANAYIFSFTILITMKEPMREIN